jgi:hypothetical protein
VWFRRQGFRLGPIQRRTKGAKGVGRSHERKLMLSSELAQAIRTWNTCAKVNQRLRSFRVR